jgi:thioredoxin-like negative regulator of GroEL
VINLAMAAVLQAGILAAEPVSLKSETLTYTEAYAQAQAQEKPLVVLVGAEWCPACVTMKKSTIPQVAQNGIFKDVAFTVVDTDRQADIAQQVMEGGSIPQLIMFHKTSEGWKRERLTGGQSASAILAFLRRGVQAAGRLVAN